jgi:hypothetical protein
LSALNVDLRRDGYLPTAPVRKFDQGLLFRNVNNLGKRLLKDVHALTRARRRPPVSSLENGSGLAAEQPRYHGAEQLPR